MSEERSRGKYAPQSKQETVAQIKAQRAAPAVTPEQAEIARLRSEVVRLEMELDIALSTGQRNRSRSLSTGVL